jgi:hypothetical protein
VPTILGDDGGIGNSPDPGYRFLTDMLDEAEHLASKTHGERKGNMSVQAKRGPGSLGYQRFPFVLATVAVRLLNPGRERLPS